ncbi:PLP-dependent cysteine synthase family protein [Streptomyces sp. JJ36]|uniref:PLP-dependent cysteine synthase family protein n=1 Tax=Streptomyces sp. JJ36 TaxID=2736645 RepID=UPI001F2FB8FD|nr:cysteine synthase family protein [Streptomyces sp. JJ36]MCF6524779.1 cysteine synthase family protein [Streptomyces sp. JJ36]
MHVIESPSGTADPGNRHPAAGTPPAAVPAPPVADRIEDLVGGTPLIRLRPAGLAPGAEVLAKLESANPLSGVKDRAALYMLRSAEDRGLLPRDGGTIVEATSGNTGISLAALAASRGHRCVIVLPDNATTERVRMLRAFGAEVVQTPSDRGYPGAIEKAEEIHAATPGSWFPCQHENPDNVAAHYATTGPELAASLSAVGRRADALVCGVGTGGTLTGIARYLRETGAPVTVVAVEPENSPVLSRGHAGQHRIPGLNGGFVAPTTDVSLIDEVLTVTDEEAMSAARHLACGQGVFTGVSAGAAVHAAAVVASRPEYAGRTVVTVLPDTGERYLSMWDA